MFSVKEIINANEIIVEPNWFYKGYSGNRVYIDGYKAPTKESEYGFGFANKKIKLLLYNKKIELFSPEFWEAYGKKILVCKVYLDGSNIKVYLPEFGGKFS